MGQVPSVPLPDVQAAKQVLPMGGARSGVGPLGVVFPPGNEGQRKAGSPDTKQRLWDAWEKGNLLNPTSLGVSYPYLLEDTTSIHLVTSHSFEFKLVLSKHPPGSLVPNDLS